MTTRIGAIIGLGRLGSGGSAANPSEYPSALRSTLPGAATKAIVSPESGFIWGMPVYIIRNGRVAPEYTAVKANTLAIAGRSISTLIKTQAIGDLYQMYELAQRNGVDYKLAYIPGDFPDTSKEPFDQVYMSKLFNLGYELGQSGGVWKKTPPRLGSAS